MAYTPHNWIAGHVLSIARMNNLETQYDEAVADIKKKMKPPTARWTSPGWYFDSNVNRVPTANRTYYMPIYVEETTTYIRIGINVAVGDGAGGLADLRIFDWVAGIPDTLVLSAGTVNTNGAGLKEIVIAQVLNPGYYFLACRCDNTPTLKGPAEANAITVPTNGLSLTGDMLNSLIILYDDAAYADPAGAVDGATTIRYAFITLREN